MSLMKSTTRLSLLAGSSLIAGLISAAGVVVAPSAASAQAVCTPIPSSGAGTSTVTYNAGTYNPGITCTAGGAPMSVSTTGSVTVSSTDTTPLVDDSGVNLIGGAQNVTWNSSAGNLAGGAQTAGPVLDVTTTTGNISITTGNVISAAAGTTHGIRATSTGGGNITITRPTGVISATVAGAVAAIEATTAGGNIAITTAGANTQGRLRGILAQTSGAGTINITTSSLVSAHATDGQAAIDTVAGTGATNIVLNGAVTGGAGAAIRSVSSGSVTIQQNSGTVTGRVNFSDVAGGVTWTNTQSFWSTSGSSVFGAAGDNVSLSSGTMASGSSIDFRTGDDTFAILFQNVDTNVSATNSTIDFGAGADEFNVAGRFVATNTAINMGADNDLLSVGGILDLQNVAIDFGSGSDTFSLDGTLLANGVTTIGGLESFDHAGAIYLGGSTFASSILTDNAADDVLRMTGGTFTGVEGSQVLMDAFLGNHQSQIGCATLVTADCMDFTGAATAGTTSVIVNDVSFDINGGTLDSIVTLVEGSSAAEHFTLDPASTYYAETSIGAAIRKPVVAYYFQYDEANQRHVLVGAPTDEPFQVGTFAAAAQETWRATTGSWLTRQADLRSTPGGLAASRGIWGRITGYSGEREATAAYSTGGVSLDFDLSQKQRIAHLNFGGDIVGGPGWLLGATLGFVRSDIEFEATPTEAAMTGFNGGLYASYVAGPWFFDGIVNTNILHVKADAPQMGIGDDVPMTFDLVSLGGQFEAGRRIPLGAAFIEPLAAVSYVVTMIDDADVPGGSGQFEFDKTRSLRYGAGARVGMDSQLIGMAASYSLTGRYWTETKGESGATITTASGSSALLVDDFSGAFSEVLGAVNLFSGDGGVSGFVNIGGKFGDDYQAVNGSVGVRVRW